MLGSMILNTSNGLWFSAIAAIALAACGTDPTPQIDVELLASERSVQVGNEVLTIPYVALSDFVHKPMSFSLRSESGNEREQARLERKAFLSRAAHRETAPKLSSITVSIEIYGSYGELGQSAQICPRLRRQWSLSICNDAYSPIYRALPRKFELVELGKFEKYKHHIFAGVRNKTVYDLISAMDFQENVSSVSCLAYDQKDHPPGKTCRAGRVVGNGLVAIWEVWESKDGHESIQDKANREGSMVAKFIEMGLGSEEDFEQLERAAIKLYSPDSPTSSGNAYSARSMKRVESYGLPLPKTAAD